MEGLPANYRDNITVDNGVEIVWVNQKGQVIPKGEKSSKGTVDDEVVVGMPRAQATLPVVEGTPVAAVVTPPGGSRRKSVAGTVSAPDLIGAWFTSTPEGAGGVLGPPSSPGGPPETEEDDADPEGHPCMALEPYASENYYKERQGLLGKKRTPMETLLSWKGKQIASPLTIACRESKVLVSESVAAFGVVMRYMGDKKAKESGMQLLKSLQMRLLEGSQDFRDEVFCQICKQTTSNPDANSDLRGWQLMLSVLAVAMPSKKLAPCFVKHCELGPVGTIPQAYAQYALSAIKKEGSLKPRRAAPCDVEIMALVQLSAVPVLVRLQDGNKVEVAADSWTSVSDLEKQVAQKLALQNSVAFTVFEVSNTDGERALGSKDGVLDTVAQWRTQACATSGVKTFQLLYKVRLHLRPNENDLAALKLTYLQAVQDLVNGVYLVSTEDCVQLAAFQLQAVKGDYDKTTTTVASLEKEMDQFVPPQVLNQTKSEGFDGRKDLASKILAYYMMSLKGVSKKDARALLLGLMYELESFGYHYFEGIALGRPAIIAVGASGIRLHDAEDLQRRTILGEYGYNEVASFTCTAEGVAVMTLSSDPGSTFAKTVSIESLSALQMKSLVHAYFVRYILPKREKEQQERQDKTEPVVPFAAA